MTFFRIALAVHISGNQIVAVTTGEDEVSYLGMKILNFGDAVISPGVIDVHAHLNEPGREEWEGTHLSPFLFVCLSSDSKASIFDSTVQAQNIVLFVAQRHQPQASAQARLLLQWAA